MAEMKYIKIQFRKGEPIYLSLLKWEKIVKSELTLVPYSLDNEPEWTGRTLNKSEVLRSEYDPEYTKKANEKLFILYRRKSTNTVVKCSPDALPDNLNDYELLQP